MSDNAKPREELDTNTPTSGRKTVKVANHSLAKRAIRPHKDPPSLPLELTRHRFSCSEKMLFLWKLLRLAHSTGNQSISRFFGWVLLICSTEDGTPTILTFLPPSLQPITDYSTIAECINQSQKLAKSANMTYAHIAIDGGAASKFYTVIRNSREEFKNVIIHLEDFHGLEEFSCVIGKIIQGSGFEEIVYESGLCTSGGLKGVLSGKHYNRSWLIHECFAEASERLFVKALVEVQNEDVLTAAKAVEFKDDCDILFAIESFVDYETKYNKRMAECQNGIHGKTAQFCIDYVQSVDRQHRLHCAINTNNFDERLQRWKDSVKFCFATNKQNYSRYGSYYCLEMDSIEETHPGAKEELETKGLSVCRNTYNMGQSIDGALEQTFMRTAKTAGCIKNFATQTNTYEKWVLLRPFAAQFVNGLRNDTGIDKTTNNPRKCLREVEIKKSEERVRKITYILENQFIYQFSTDPERDKLYNLASGKPVRDDCR